MILALLVAVAVLALTVMAKKNKGVASVRGRELRMMQGSDCKALILAAQALVIAALVAALVVGYSVYCMMAVGVVLFVAAVYYTVTVL